MFTPVRLLGAGNRFYECKIEDRNTHYAIQSHFNVAEEFRAMKGSRWLGYAKPTPEKVWVIDKCDRNEWALAYLRGENPYARFKKELDPNTFFRTHRVNREGIDVQFYQHQIEFIKHMLNARHSIIAGEMGLGKSLAAIEVAELSHAKEIWYAAPKSALTSVRREVMEWRSVANFIFMTYDELKTRMKNWSSGNRPPQVLFCDESSRLKTPESQRSQAVQYLADEIRKCYKYDSFITLMTGSPSPKSPLDWWFQCEIVCPGYIKEGDYKKFRKRLAVMEYKEDMGMGMSFPVLKTWRTGDPELCNECGNPKFHVRHIEKEHKQFCVFEPLKDEVGTFYKRAKGLVLVKMKKDCLDLPDKVYRQIKVKPTLDLMRASRNIITTNPTVIQAMTLCRELSDGFQYFMEKVEDGVCPLCQGIEGSQCGQCMGTGKTYKEVRKLREVPCPKFDVVNDLLDECEDSQRTVVYAGFTGSIDRICKHVKQQGWEFIRVDGRGWNTSLPDLNTDQQMLDYFQRVPDDKKVVFVAHPGSAGMGLTLTASQMIVYFSNDFNGESRIQSEDRIHRIGMKDTAVIVDIFLLPTDEKVFNNLKQKRELQSMTMGEIVKAMEMAA